MIRLECDYNTGAHPKVLAKLVETNLEETAGYGEDPYCQKAADLIKQHCQREDIDVHFLVGGTQVNLTLIAAALRPHQGVISADSGHINTHETGAIEATGHKVLPIFSPDGKLTAQGIQELVQAHSDDETKEHIVKPKLVYLSNPTECGSLYSYEELKAIRIVCDQYGLYLYLDGARLAYALCASNNDLTLPQIASLCDAFYIGGTKVGTLFGEALVIRNNNLKEDFRYIMKQKGGLLAKGRLLGLQFIALFEDDLYLEIGCQANDLASLIKDACRQKGYFFLVPSQTNQQFPILPNSLLQQLDQDFAYSFWQKMDENHSAVRFCTGWATRKEDVVKLTEIILQS